MAFLWIALGLGLLALGGELIVRGGAATARLLGVPQVIVGVVLLGFGTSAPELFTSLQGAMAGAPGIALGNVVGSNIANILLIAGVAVAISGATATGALLGRDAIALGAATIAFSLALFFDAFTHATGIAFLGGLAVYLWISVQSARKADFIDDDADEGPDRLEIALGLFVIGVGATVLGARFLVDGAIDLARGFQLSEALIGATIVAVGTSLPELAATIAAAMRRRPELALGNVFGSNVFNVLAVAGATSAVIPLSVPTEIQTADMWVMLAATAALLYFAGTGRQVSRSEGLALLAGYVLYLLVAAANAGAFA